MRFALLMAAVCAVSLHASAAAEDGPVRVASLSTVLTDLMREVGGDEVEIHEVVGPGVDPHEFDPAPGDMRALRDAELILATGLGFETYLDRLEASLGPDQRLLAVGDLIENPILDDQPHDHDHNHGHDHAHDHGGSPDPHWWHGMENMRTATRAIVEALAQLRPSRRGVFEANGAAYLERLDALETWARLQIAEIPREQRILVTSHDALAYFARDHGFVIIPVQGLSTADEPTSREVRGLIDEIRAAGVPVIFADSVQSPRVLREITRETGATLGGELYSDALGKEEAATYEAMMRHNVSVIVAALKPEN